MHVRAAFLAGILGLAHAAEFKRLDGVHRIPKGDPQITAAPAGLERRAEGVCATGLYLCPSSLNGGCCEDGYECASESCFATTRGAVTCGGHEGWYGCGREVGGKKGHHGHDG